MFALRMVPGMSVARATEVYEVVKHAFMVVSTEHLGLSSYVPVADVIAWAEPAGVTAADVNALLVFAAEDAGLYRTWLEDAASTAVMNVAI